MLLEKESSQYLVSIAPIKFNLEPISKLIFSVYTSLSHFSNAHLLRVNSTACSRRSLPRPSLGSCAFRKALASSKRKISNYEIGSNIMGTSQNSKYLGDFGPLYVTIFNIQKNVKIHTRLDRTMICIKMMIHC